MKKGKQEGTLTDCSTASIICLNMTSTPDTLGETATFVERFDNEGPRIMVDKSGGSVSCIEPVLLALNVSFSDFSEETQVRRLTQATFAQISHQSSLTTPRRRTLSAHGRPRYFIVLRHSRILWPGISGPSCSDWQVRLLWEHVWLLLWKR